MHALLLFPLSNNYMFYFQNVGNNELFYQTKCLFFDEVKNKYIIRIRLSLRKMNFFFNNQTILLKYAHDWLSNMRRSYLQRKI